MSRKTILQSVRVGIVVGIFSAGFLCGSLTQHSANADWGELGGAVLKQAGESGGVAGSVVQLSTAITEMDKHVSGLQQNLDTLKKVKASLGGK